MAGSDRLEFLRRLARDTARAAIELDSALRLRPDEPGADETLPPELLDADAEPPPVGPAARTATADDLRRLCRELGLEPWADAAVTAARASIRLTASDGPTAARLGAGLPLPPGLEAPAWRGAPLDLLLRVDLAALPPSRLPARGSLLVFFALAEAPDGTLPEHEGACRVVHVEEADAPAGGVALAPSAELTLPLDPPETETDVCGYGEWLELRTRLAELQGVELEETVPVDRPLHRLLGHPDSLAERMAPEDDPDALLLVQVSPDPAAGILLPPGERLFLWLAGDDLDAGRLDRVRAFVR